MSLKGLWTSLPCFIEFCGLAFAGKNTFGKSKNSEWKESTLSGERLRAWRDGVKMVPQSPSSRCSGCWNSHQHSCGNVGSHLGVWRGCIITYRQQSSQMLPIHFKDQLQVGTCEKSPLPDRHLINCNGSFCRHILMGALRTELVAASRDTAQLLCTHTRSSRLLLSGRRMKPSKSVNTMATEWLVMLPGVGSNLYLL